MNRGEGDYVQDAELKAVEIPLLLKQQARILFGMTGRQLLLITCGLAISFSLWESFSSLQESLGILLWGCLCIIPTTLSVLFAFFSAGTRSLGEWLFILFVWMLTPERVVHKKQFLRTFYKIRTIHTDTVSLDLGKHFEYQAVLKIEGKDFDLMSTHEQLTLIETFKKLLNGLSYPISIHIRTSPYIPTICTTNVPEHPVKALRRSYADYLFFISQLVISRPPVRVSYYLTVPAGELEEKGETRRLELANIQLASRIQEITKQLARANLSCQQLQRRELLTFYRESFLQEELPIDQDSLINSTLFELLAPRSIIIKATQLEIEGKHVASLALTNLPRNTYSGWIHHLIKANEPNIDISIFVQPYTSDIIAMQLRRKAVELGGVVLAAEKQGKRGNTITRHALKDIERVRDKLIRKDTHVFAVTLLLLIHGSSYDELNERVRRVQLILRSLDFQASPLHFQHHLGYLSTLYGHNMLHRYSHLLPTEAVATFYPFSNVPMLEDGVLLGAARGNLVSMNPFSKERLNANLAVLGVPGAGKSFFLKVMLSRLAPSTAISVIDIEGEYTRWTQAIGARHISFTADSLHINPLELPDTKANEGALPKNVLREKITNLLGFFALLIGDNGTLTQYERALISQCLMDTYAAHGITSDPATHKLAPPSLSSFSLQLKRQEPGGDLWYRLTPYLHLLPEKTRVSFDYQHMVYDLQQLPEALRPAIIYLITEKLWHALRENRQTNEQGESTRHLVVIDEAWFLSKFEYGAVLLNEFARRIRKYGGAIWAGTQQIGDLLGTEQGKNLLSLCETKVLFKQDVTSINAVASQLHLNQAQINFLKTARQGEALYLTSRDTLAVEILASEQEAAMARTEGHPLSQE